MKLGPRGGCARSVGLQFSPLRRGCLPALVVLSPGLEERPVGLEIRFLRRLPGRQDWCLQRAECSEADFASVGKLQTGLNNCCGSTVLLLVWSREARGMLKGSLSSDRRVAFPSSSLAVSLWLPLLAEPNRDPAAKQKRGLETPSSHITEQDGRGVCCPEAWLNV